MFSYGPLDNFNYEVNNKLLNLRISPNAGKYGPEKLRIPALYAVCLLSCHIRVLE